MTDAICLRVEVPVCSFRPFASREYQDTFPFPSPSSVYGMLLSLLGVPREEKARHRGAEIALALENSPTRSRVFRKLRRGDGLAGEKGSRPDYQDILLDLKLWLWLRKGKDQAAPPLSQSIATALSDTRTIKRRFGGLSLGESSYLVDLIRIDPTPEHPIIFVFPDPEKGFYTLPTWVDHTDSRNTVTQRFRLSEPMTASAGLKSAWTHIGE